MALVCPALIACVAIAGTTDQEIMLRRREAGTLAVRLEPPPSGAAPLSCGYTCVGALTGRYRVRADSCYEWGDDLPHGYVVSKLPDFSLIPAEPIILEVADTAVGAQPAYRFTLEPGAAAPRRSFVVPVRSRGDSSPCNQCGVYQDDRSPGNFGGRGGFVWALGRTRSGALLYSIAYESHWSTLGVQRHELRRMQCTFAADTLTARR